MNIQRWERLQQSPVTKEHRNRKAGRLFAHAYSCSHKNSLNKAGVRGNGPSPELLALRPHRASSGPAAASRGPPCAQPLPAAPTSGRCSRSLATRTPLRPGPMQALGPGGPGAARSRGPESPCLAVSLRGSCGQLCGTPGALSRVPGRGAGRCPEEAEAPLVAAGWRATWLRAARCRLGSAGKASVVPAGCKPPVPRGPALVFGLVSMVTGSATLAR